MTDAQRWRIEGIGSSGRVQVFDADGRQVAIVTDGYILAQDHCSPAPPQFTAEEIDVHARLAAAAPEMRDALQAAHEVLDQMFGPCEPDCDCVLHTTAAALAAAKVPEARP